jgi:hypothetical protein
MRAQSALDLKMKGGVEQRQADRKIGFNSWLVAYADWDAWQELIG